MPRRSLLCGAVVALLTLTVAAGCDGAGGTPKRSPSASGSSAASPSASSPSPTVTQNEMMLQAAQKQYQAFYAAYIDASRNPPPHPPKGLLAMTDRDGSQDEWLIKAFANAQKSGGRITRGEPTITTGPESASNGTRRTVLKFRACLDLTDVYSNGSGSEKPLTWELLDVEMRASDDATAQRRATKPDVWKVYRSSNVGTGDECTFE